MRFTRGQTFWRDIKFGRARAMRRVENEYRMEDFAQRQKVLALLGFTMLAQWVIFGHWLFAVLCVLALTTGTREARRMRACGRHWQCRRSIETVGY